MNINEITIGQLKELKEMIGENSVSKNKSIQYQIGEKVIIRTYSAGVWYGTLSQKEGNEVVLTNARRLWMWWAKKGISLSGVAVFGINQEKSKLAPKVPGVWLEAIEILPTTKISQESIEGAKDADQSS